MDPEMKIFRDRRLVLAAVAVLFFSARLALADELAEASVGDATEAAAPDEPPPLPFHTIEGMGGGAITPMAYLVNPGDECHVFGKPAVALTYAGLGQKNFSVISVTETAFQRVEFGYAAARLGLGTLPSDIHTATGIDLTETDIWLHHFNVRALLVKENTCAGEIPLPAITAGVHFKVNGNIDDVNQELGGGTVLPTIGYRDSSGIDYTLTATKTIPPDVLGRPLILTAGLRLSEASQLGFLGFGDEYRPTFEGSVAFLPLDRVLVAYEFRQKADPYGQIPGLIDGEDNWHAFDAALILNNNSTLVAGYGIFGTLANTNADGAWWLQLKHEF
jgi:hypothetical protein